MIIVHANTATDGVTATISNISPSTVKPGSTHSLTILGTDFEDGSTVSVDGTAATGVQVVDSTTITCTTPLISTTGTKPVTVTTSGGTSAAFNITAAYPAPTYTFVSPQVGGVGTVLNFNGSEFVSGQTTATIGGVNATCAFISENQVQITVPGGLSATTHNITVTTPGGTVTASAAYTHYLTPTVSSISPTQGGAGTTVQVTGTNFVTGSGLTAFRVGNSNANSAFTNVLSSTLANFIIPGSTSGLNSITVTTYGGTSTLSGAFTYYYPPVVGSLSPSSGKTGDTLTVSGAEFVPGQTTATIGGLAATVSGVSANSLSLTVPSGLSAGSQAVSVTTPGGSSTASAAYTHYVAPTISSTSPASAGAGSTLTLTGTGFVVGETTATVAGVAATCSASSTTSATVTVPTLSRNGNAEVTLTTPGGSATGSYTHWMAPTFSSVSPTQGKVGDTLTVTGANFVTGAGNTTATIGGVSATCSVNSATQLQLTVPTMGTGGAKNIVISSVGGTVTATNAYTHFLAPTFTSVAPSSGKTGDTLTVTGANFVVGATTATIGGISATCSASSTTSATLTVPSGLTAGAKNIALTTTGGTVTATNAYTHFLAPTIASFSPSSTTASTATSVTITGTNFVSGGTTCTVNGTSRTVTFNSSTSITVAFQALSRGTYPVIVSTTGGTASANYQYTLVPTASSISPTSTFFDEGAKTYTITGSNFISSGVVAATAVDIGGTNYAATIASETSLSFSANLSTAGTYNARVKAPDGNSGQVTVTSNWRPAPTITSVSSSRGLAGTVLPGNTITVTGTNFTFGTTTVTFGGTTITPTGLSATGFSFTCPSLSGANNTDGAKTLTVTTSGSNSAAASNSSLIYYASRAAETTTYNTNGTFTIPDWCNAFDVVVVGGGQGGGRSAGTLFNGGGGRAGSWAGASYQRSTIGWGVTSLSAVPGSGSSGASVTGHAAAGSASTCTGTNVSVSGAGGPGGNSNATQSGVGSGNYTFNGVTYTGSADTNGAGNAPGGGGGGGLNGAVGFAGATGRVLIRCYQ